jgi:hypothetical protein
VSENGSCTSSLTILCKVILPSGDRACAHLLEYLPGLSFEDYIEDILDSAQKDDLSFLKPAVSANHRRMLADHF